MIHLHNYKVACVWKNEYREFTVYAVDHDSACELARKQCKKLVKMPPSSIQRVIFVGQFSETCETGCVMHRPYLSP